MDVVSGTERMAPTMPHTEAQKSRQMMTVMGGTSMWSPRICGSIT
jgi:hypothetical protein